LLKSRLARNEEKTALRLLLPAFIILIVVAIYPLGTVFYTSLTDKGFASTEETHFVGFENYKRLLSLTIKELPPKMTLSSLLDEHTAKQEVNPKTGELVYEKAINILPREPIRYKELVQFSLFGKRYVIGATDPDFIQAIGNTLQFTIISVILETILGLGIALVVNSGFKGRGVMRAVMLVPWAVITVVSARIWHWILQSSRVGLFNTILCKFGIGGGQIAFLSEEIWQVPSMIIIDVWKTTPFMALLLLAGLQIIPEELYEAANIDGAGKVKQFMHITLPLLKPALAVALIFRTLDALRVFDLFQVILGSREYSMATYNYFQLIGNRAMGYSSAVGVIIFIIIFAFAILYIKALGVRSSG